MVKIHKILTFCWIRYFYVSKLAKIIEKSSFSSQKTSNFPKICTFFRKTWWFTFQNRQNWLKIEFFSFKNVKISKNMYFFLENVMISLLKSTKWTKNWVFHLQKWQNFQKSGLFFKKCDDLYVKITKNDKNVTIYSWKCQKLTKISTFYHLKLEKSTIHMRKSNKNWIFNSKLDEISENCVLLYMKYVILVKKIVKKG